MLKRLDWDSNFFEFEVGEMIADEYCNFNNLPNFDLLYLKSNFNFDLEINNFQKTFQEVKLVFEREINLGSQVSESIFSIKEIDFNIKEIYNLAYESGKHSRFLLDKKFKAEKFQELYRTWVDNSINKSFAKDVLVYIENNQILGFVTYKININSATVGLFAVNAKHQGKGIGSQLIKHLENILFLNQINKLVIPTQESNKTACDFYRKQGYTIIETTFIKHFWKNDTIQ
jgi:dTDP-4-amino-4,6-dideoxy-D-galactose acyltransferase